jgi:hypothetical protein
MRRGMTILLVIVGTTGCGIARLDGGPDAAEIPGGPVEAIGAEAIGPVTEVGTGRTLGIGWRYAIFESTDGMCTQLELSSQTSTGCGPLPLLAEGSHLGWISGGGGPDDSAVGPTPYDGVVSSDVAEVWLRTESGGRIATTLMSLAGAGLDAKAFVGVAPGDQSVTGVVAVDADGEELETFDLP